MYIRGPHSQYPRLGPPRPPYPQHQWVKTQQFTRPPYGGGIQQSPLFGGQIQHHQNRPPYWAQNQQPFPPQQFGPPPRPSIIDYFKDENGKLDFNKMSGTVGQVMSTVNQVSPIVKQMGALFGGPK